VNSENGKIDLHQSWVDIGMEMLDQITKGLIDQDDEENGRERLKKGSNLSRPFPIGG
jgi:hypothetical protein